MEKICIKGAAQVLRGWKMKRETLSSELVERSAKPMSPAEAHVENSD